MTIGNPIIQEGTTKPSSLEQQVYEPDLFAQRTIEIPSNQKERFEWDANNRCIYRGAAPKGLAEGSNGWLLIKYTYDANGNLLEKNIAYGNWTNRTSYTYE